VADEEAEATMDGNADSAAPPKIVTVRPDKEVMTRQKLPYFIGISADSAGAKAISMNMVVIPPGGSAEPHMHQGFETAIYVIKGRVLTRYGEGLAQESVNESGDFLFIPASLPHQPVNLSDTEAAIAIVARNVADEQESVVHYDPSAQ
jgi:uncharacterized RmlC-like cupin family protein